MRKKIFLITAFLCIAAVADAQLNTLFEQENPAGFSDVTNVVYANIQGRHYAIYHVRGNGEKIRIIDFTNYYMGVPASSGAFTLTREFEIEQDYSISDIAVSGDYLFFCGKKSVGGTPYTPTIFNCVLGSLDLAQLSSPSNISLTYNEITTASILGSHMDKLVAYPDGANIIKVVAIAEKDYPSPGDQTRRFFVVESRFSTSSGNFFSMDYRYLWDNYAVGGNNLEVAHELIKTTNHLAIIGYRTDFEALCIRRCDPSAVLGTPMDTIYYYPSTTHDVLSMMHSTCMSSSDDKISISYLTNSYNSYYSTCVREIDLYNMAMLSSQEVITNEKSEPIALKYSDVLKRNILVQSFVFPAGTYYTTNFISLQMSCSSGYMAPNAFRKVDWFSSATLNPLNTTDVIAVSCNYDIFIHDMSFWSTPSTPGCPHMSTIQVKYIRPVNTLSIIDPKIRMPLVFSQYLFSKPTSTFTPYNTCESH